MVDERCRSFCSSQHTIVLYCFVTLSLLLSLSGLSRGVLVLDVLVGRLFLVLSNFGVLWVCVFVGSVGSQTGSEGLVRVLSSSLANTEDQ